MVINMNTVKSYLKMVKTVNSSLTKPEFKKCELNVFINKELDTLIFKNFSYSNHDMWLQWKYEAYFVLQHR